jgi:hypothetical protein
MQIEYWTALNTALDAGGRSYFAVAVVMNRAKRQMRAQLSILGVRAKEFFNLLKNQKDAVERELGYPLEWEELPEGQECRVSAHLNDADPEDKADWPRQHEWLAKRMNDLHRVFSQRVKAPE